MKKLLLGLSTILALSALAIGCASEGNYTSYTDGSRMDETRVTAHGARVAVTQNTDDGRNGPYTYYKLRMDFKGGPRNFLELDRLYKGAFLRMGKNKVQVTIKKSDNMIVSSDDSVLSERLEQIIVLLTYSRHHRTASNKHTGDTWEEVDHKYEIKIAMFDENAKLLSTYRETVTDSHEVYIGEPWDRGERGPRGPISNIYNWMTSQADAQKAQRK